MKKLIFLLLILNVAGLLAQSTVEVWQQALTLPTYKLGAPDLNPMFYNNESYQGAQRKIYPYPLMDHLTSVREPQTYQALYLENEYIRIIS